MDEPVRGVSIPMFTGLVRDFAKFKNEFEAVVVSNRHPTDVTMYLRAAVPTELESQLFDSLDFPHYIEMMGVLQSKFGNPRHIVVSYLKDFDGMKTPGSKLAIL